MSQWTGDELATIGSADELEIAARRRDGTLRSPVTIWVVSLGDELYVRSVNGPGGAWFRGTQLTHEGRIRAGSVAKDVAFEAVDHAIDDQLDAAYRSKYRRYAPGIVNSVLTPGARSATVRLVPQ